MNLYWSLGIAIGLSIILGFVSGDDIIEKVMYTIVTAIISLLLMLMGYVIYLHITGPTEGIITQRQFTEAHTSETFSCNTNTHICTTDKTSYPASYTIYYKNDDKENWANVPESVWNQVKIGDMFDANCLCIIKQ